MSIDWARVSELVDEIGAETFADLLDMFTQEVSEGVERLRVAQTPVRQVPEFHFLKGAALNLGLAEMAELCAEGEKRATAGLDADEQRDRVLAEFEKATTELKETWRDRITG